MTFEEFIYMKEQRAAKEAAEETARVITEEVTKKVTKEVTKEDTKETMVRLFWICWKNTARYRMRSGSVYGKRTSLL